MGGHVQASGCTVTEGEVVVPQLRTTAARVGPITSVVSDEDGPAQGSYFWIVTFPEVQDADTNFGLFGDADLNACDLAPHADRLPVSPHSADFDVTFYNDADQKRGDSFDSCGDERGTVPLFSSFAVIWLTAGSVPTSSFTFSMC